MPADHRPVRYIETDAETGQETVVYRASGLMICERALIALASGMKGAERPAWFQQVLDEGSIVEGDIAAMHDEATGLDTVNDQAEVELEIGEINGRLVIVRGHIDGEVMYDNDEFVGREFKKFRESTWRNFLRQGIEINKNYPWQASVYWHAREWDALEFVGGHITGYEAPDGTVHDEPELPDGTMGQPIVGEIEVKHLEAPPIALKDIRKRIVRFERLIAEGGAVMDTACDKSQYPCPFYTLHDEEDNSYALPKNKRTGEIVQTFVNIDTRKAELAAQMRELDKAKTTIVKELREIIGAEGKDADEAKEITYDAGNGVTHVITRKRYHQAEKTVGAYDVDSMSVKKPAKPKSRVKKAHGVEKA